MTTAADVAQMLGAPARTSKPSRVPALPEDIATMLRTAWENRRVDGNEPLFTIVVSLREKGWSLAAVAKPLGVTREIVRVWTNQAAELDLPRITVPSPPGPVVTHEVVAREQAQLRRMAARNREEKALADLLPKMLAVKDEAEALRGPSKTSPDKADASAEYTRLMDEALRRGVRSSRLARELGIRPVTIYARLRRGGYRPPAPSEVDTMPSWADGPLVAQSA